MLKFTLLLSLFSCFATAQFEYFSQYIYNNSTQYLYFPHWHSDTCPYESTTSLNNLVLPANLMCPDNEPSCYEPPRTLDVGIALLNGCFKSLKSYSKYTGRNEVAALMGSLNAMGDFSALCLQGNISFKEVAIFSTRIVREFLRASTGPMIHRIGSLDDITAATNPIEIALHSKALLKIPLIIEKNLDWGKPSTSTSIWLASSLPGLLLSLTEHYSRYFKHYALRPVAGFTLTILEFISFCSICTEENSLYKNIRQLIRTLFHAAQYMALFQNRHQEHSEKFRHFTILSIIEHLGLALSDALYFKLNEPTPTNR